jgi:diguanylate cyclase (GGDEF)-like protein
MPKKRTSVSGPRRLNGGSDDPLQRLSELTEARNGAAPDQSASDADQTASDADQTASDADQTASDADQMSSDVDRDLSAGDQRSSDRDQVASDDDQAVADMELERHPDPSSQKAHDASLAKRLAGSKERKKAGEARGIQAESRARQAAQRDDTAWRRDLTAQARDGAADRRDRESAKLERKMASHASSLRTALTHASEIRERAAEDRVRAAEDRAQAARDRERAAAERDEVLAELRRAHLDELTGAFRRGLGEEALQAEIDRARRGDARLMLAFVDVDALRDVNNREGHASGDMLLRNVVATIRANIRSYEPIVRFGGDEFVCAVSNLDLAQAEERFRVIQDAIAAGGNAVSVGLAEMRPEDSLDDLIERADAALLDVRRQRAAKAD